MSVCRVRGIRGAITVDGNTPQAITEAARKLVETILEQNEIDTEEISWIIFTVTKDLNAAFPAQGARQAGLVRVPLLCTNEIDVPDALPLCLRILMQVNTPKSQQEIKHVYLKGAKVLRPDLLQEQN